MRQFILAKEYASDKVTGFTEGQINVVWIDSIGAFNAFDGDAPTNAKGLQLVGLINGMPINIPIWKKLISLDNIHYQEPSIKQISVNIPDPETAGDYTLIVALKGKSFNERNKYSASVHVSLNQVGVMTGATLAKKLATQLTSMLGEQGFSIELVSKPDGSVAAIDISAPEEVDFELLVADEFTGIAVAEISSDFTSELAGEAMIKDMAAKAAADAGIEYTYQDASNYLYPTYPLDTDTKTASDGMYSVVTLRFAEPRVTKTTDDVVTQVVQIAGPDGEFDILYGRLSRLL